MPSLSVVIPAFNEERGIAATVSRIAAWLAEHGHDGEVLVVDNASTDGTVAALEPLLDGERVRLLRNDRNRGKGFSLRRGMLEARGELILHCDADCAVCLPSLPVLLALVEHADVVIGSRLAPGARIGRRQSLPRRIAGRSFQGLCRVALDEPARDLFCGFKLWRREAARACYERAVPTPWVFDAEVLALARALGFTAREAGIAWEDREGSRLSMARVLLPVCRDLLGARRRVRAAAAAASVARA